MGAYRRILAAVDGSTMSEQALKEAIAIAADMQAELRIIHVVDEAPLIIWATAYARLDEVRESYRQSAQQILDEAVAEAKSAGLDASSRLLYNDAVGMRVGELLTREARDWPADLIVLGTHGRRGFSHMLLGSVAEAVVRIASTPVLLVRGD
jgi:nucleotide-binding universal stress UspA family protein